MLVVDVLFPERCDLFAVQGVRAGRACGNDVPLINFQPDVATDVFLRLVHKRGECFAQRREPLSVIDKLRKADGNVLFEMLGLLVEAEHFQLFVRKVQDGSAGRFVHAAALHTDEAVFHDVDDPHAVLAADLVEFVHQLHRTRLFAVQRDRNALFKSDRDIGGFVGRLFGRHAHFQDLVVFGLVCGIFQIQPFVRKMPQVFILGIAGLAGDLQGNVVRFRVIDLFVAALDVPDPPRRDDRHFGRKCLDGQFKTDLIVSLARAAVADGVRPFFLGDLDNALCNDGTCKRSAEQVFVFVHRARLHRGINVILNKFFAQVLYVQLGSARFESLLFQPVQLALLPDIGGNGDHFAVVIIFFQPRDDDGRIQPARISKDNLLDLFLFHMGLTSKFYCLKLYPQPLAKSSVLKQLFSKIFNFKQLKLYKMYKYAYFLNNL